VWEAAMRGKVFRAKGLSEPMDGVRRHCVLTGHVARIVASSAGIDGELAFLCGLLHDVGFAGLLLAISDDHALAARVDPSRLLQDLDPMHEDASDTMIRLWKLPDGLRVVTAR